MKSGKNPNREQKKILSAHGYDANEWLVIKDKGDSYEFRKKLNDGDTPDKAVTIVLNKNIR